LIYVDEHGINLWTRRNRARAPKGQRAYVTVPSQRNQNLTIIAAVSGIFGKICMSHQHGAMNGGKFGEFMETLKIAWNSSPKIPNAVRQLGFIVIFDNCRAHVENIVQAALNDTQHAFRFLPPWSPFLNHIEQVFGDHKAFIKAEHIRQRPAMVAIDVAPRGTKMADRRALLENLATSSWEQVDDNIVTNHFLHMLSYIPRCIAEEIILS
jgi:hypothetical protein